MMGVKHLKYHRTSHSLPDTKERPHIPGRTSRTIGRPTDENGIAPVQLATGYINVPLDLLLVTLYLLVAYGVCWCLRIQTKQVALRTVCIALVTVAISGFFVWYLTRRPPSSSFFAQWFHRVGWTGVVYDVFLLVVLYVVYRRLCEVGSVRPLM